MTDGLAQMDAGGDVLIQVHIPKCAGTSVSRWMLDSCAATGAAFAQLYIQDLIFDDESLWETCLKVRAVRGASSHGIRRFPAAIRGRRIHYFTILRHPLSNLLSAVRYMQQERTAFAVPAGVGRSTQDMTAHLLSRPIGAPFRENPQTNHLALHEWCARTGGRCDPAAYGAWNSADQAAYASERLELAKELLRGFLVVGTVERLPVAMDLLRGRSAAYGITLLPFEEAQRLNRTTIPLDDISWIERTELGSRLHDAVALDLELFRYGEQLLSEATSG